MGGDQYVPRDLGVGTLGIGDGGLVESTAATLGEFSGGSGIVTVFGDNSRWVHSGALTLAEGGNGTLEILVGGTVTLGGDINGPTTFTGSNVSTLTFDGGTLDMLGHNLGVSGKLLQTLHFRRGTLKNVNQINNGAGLTKTTSDTLILDGTNTYTGTTTVSAGTLVFKTSYITGSAVNVANGATAQIAQSAATPNDIVLKTGAINTNSSGRLDVMDNKVIVTAGAVGTASGGVYTGLTGLIQSGRNGGAWNGAGIITSLASGNFTTLGVATAQQAGRAGGTFAGVSVAASDVLVMYTYGGDANLDGKINVDDYGRIDFNVNLGVSGWFNGDFNYDGKINVDDYGIIDFNVGIQGSPFSTGSDVGGLTAVPEPTPLAVAGVTMGLVTGQRRRKRQTR